MSVVDGSFDHPLKLEERAAMPLAGGILRHGHQCGMLWGATLAAGAQAYRALGPGPQAEAAAVVAAQRLVESFRADNKHIDCLEITGLNLIETSKSAAVRQVLKYFVTGGLIRCFSMAARYAPVAFGDINAALSEGPVEAPSAPVSCAAVVAQRMGMSAMHAVMAAGFAGGIGLSGGACGALGAAIWVIAMNSGKDGVENIKDTPPGAKEAIDRFLKSTGSRFACSEIAGRRFQNVDEHAAYLRDGGCSKVIEVLAAA